MHIKEQPPSKEPLPDLSSSSSSSRRQPPPRDRTGAEVRSRSSPVAVPRLSLGKIREAKERHGLEALQKKLAEIRGRMDPADGADLLPSASVGDMVPSVDLLKAQLQKLATVGCKDVSSPLGLSRPLPSSTPSSLHDSAGLGRAAGLGISEGLS